MMPRLKVSLMSFFMLATIFTVPFVKLAMKETISQHDRMSFNRSVSATIEKPKYRLFSEEKPFVMWTMDMHKSTIKDMRHRLEPLGVQIIEKSLSIHCESGHCGNSLKVINHTNALSLTPAIIDEFYQAYKDDDEMATVDAFLCFHPPALCELFIPFQKNIIIVASLRYEMGRHEASQWKSWNDNLRLIAEDPHNIVGANNLYDAEYIKYFTGIQPRLLPSFCGYIDATYRPVHPEFLLFAGRGLHSGFSVIFLQEYMKTCEKKRLQCPTIRYVRDVFRNSYSYEGLASYQALVHAPHQVSVMSFFEQYRMSIPLFFPSPSLMAKWEHERGWLKERTFEAIMFGSRPNGSMIPPHPSQEGIPDPNTIEDHYAISYWIKFADFYQWPYVTYYDSYEDLVTKLTTVDLAAVSQRMKVYNKGQRQRLDVEWKKILFHIASHGNSRKDFW